MSTNALPTLTAAMLMPSAKIARDLTLVPAKLDIQEMEETALVKYCTFPILLSIKIHFLIYNNKKIMSRNAANPDFGYFI